MGDTSFAGCEDACVDTIFGSLDQEIGKFVEIFWEFDEVN